MKLQVKKCKTIHRTITWQIKTKVCRPDHLRHLQNLSTSSFMRSIPNVVDGSLYSFFTISLTYKRCKTAKNIDYALKRQLYLVLFFNANFLVHTSLQEIQRTEETLSAHRLRATGRRQSQMSLALQSSSSKMSCLQKVKRTKN